MVTRRWDPYSDLRQMQETMNRLWHGFSPSASNGGPEMESWAIPLDVYQEGDNIVVCASLPGVDPEAIDISIEDNVLTIKAHSTTGNQPENGNYLMHERRFGSFHRALRMPDSVDFDKAQTHYEHGVLSITFPKVESKKARQLKVAIGGADSNATANKELVGAAT